MIPWGIIASSYPKSGITVPGNLVFYYTMDAGTINIGAQTIADSSGNNYQMAMNGSFTSGSEVTGQIGGGLAFNGSSQFLQYSAPVSFFGSGGFTYTGWVNILPGATGPGNIFAGTASAFPQFRITNNARYLQLTSEFVADLEISTVVIPENVWVFVGLSYNTSTGDYAFYTNGSANGSGTNLVTFSNSILTIGYSPLASGEYFLGSMDDMRIYSAVLTPTQILEIYNSGLSGHP